MSTILLVDDDSSFQFLIKSLLERGDTQVIVARTSDEGLARARDSQPDIILMDIRLPGSGINGWEVTRIIKEDPALQHIPIIIVTATYDFAEDIHAEDFGCEAIFYKPFDVQEFRQFVRQYL